MFETTGVPPSPRPGLKKKPVERRSFVQLSVDPFVPRTEVQPIHERPSPTHHRRHVVTNLPALALVTERARYRYRQPHPPVDLAQ